MLNYTDKEINKTIYKYYPCNIDANSLRYRFCKKTILKKRKYYIAWRSKEEKKWKRQIERIFQDYETLSWTDLSTYDCFQYKVLLHKFKKIMDDDKQLMLSLNGYRVDFRIFISVLGPFYFYYINETYYDPVTNNWSFAIGKDYSSDPEIEERISLIQLMMQEKGYTLITEEQSNRILPDIDTEYIEKGSCRVFDCLFTQIDGF